VEEHELAGDLIMENRDECFSLDFFKFIIFYF
jgi:hypothetical protein